MAVGIIAEYNPFHNGHRYQIEQIHNKLNNPAIVAVMSGSFTQRGEPAILNKFIRAESAVKGGCDLVLELPFIYVVRSAQDFARGAVGLLAKLGIVNTLAFGAEIDDLQALNQAANISADSQFQNNLINKLDSGISYANAFCQALSEMTLIDENVLRRPNTILAIEYLRALKSTSINPLLIKRTAADYDDKNLHSGISSASAIRAAIYNRTPPWNEIAEAVDAEVFLSLKSADLPSTENLFRPLITKIMFSKLSNLKSIYAMNEGLENKLMSAAKFSKTYDELVNLSVSRRYTRSRIQRLLLYLLMGVTNEQVKLFDAVGAAYARVLAFNQRGRQLLKSMKTAASIPIIIKTAQHLTSRAVQEYYEDLQIYQQMLTLDIKATDLQSLLCSNFKPGQDFLTSVKI